MKGGKAARQGVGVRSCTHIYIYTHIHTYIHTHTHTHTYERGESCSPGRRGSILRKRDKDKDQSTSPTSRSRGKNDTFSTPLKKANNKDLLDSGKKRVAISDTDTRSVYSYDSDECDMDDVDREVGWWKDECHRLRIAVKVCVCVCVCVYVVADSICVCCICICI